MKSGYLYVLVHPSDPDLYKIGVTILHPEKRLAQHNYHYEKHAGRSSKTLVGNGNSRHTSPSLIRIGPKRLFGQQRWSQICRFEEELNCGVVSFRRCARRLAPWRSRFESPLDSEAPVNSPVFVLAGALPQRLTATPRLSASAAFFFLLTERPPASSAC